MIANMDVHITLMNLIFGNWNHSLSYSSFNCILKSTTRIIGLGGAGCFQIDRDIDFWSKLGETIAVNTDLESLHNSHADHKLLIGPSTCMGKGCKGDVDMGLASANESGAQFNILLEQCDKAILLVGLGGGTGTGALLFIARLASLKDLNVSVLASVPFIFEGYERHKTALKCINELSKTDLINKLQIIDYNEKLNQCGSQTPFNILCDWQINLKIFND